MTSVLRTFGASAALVVALGGCASGGSSALEALADSKPPTHAPAREPGSVALAPAELIAKVPDTLAKSTSARMDIAMEMSGLGSSGDALHMTVGGAYDFKTLESQMSMAMKGVPGVGDIDIEMRMVDGAIYMDVSDIAALTSGAGLPPNVKWMKLDLEELTEGLGGGLGFASEGTDPSKTFEMLRSLSGDVETVGREEVRGVDTTHYRVVVDLAKAADSLPSDVKALLPSLGVAPGGLPLEVWIDDDGLLRRMDMRLDIGAMLAGAGASGGGVISMRADVYDYGVDVDVEVPPADQTVDMSSMLGSFAGA